MTQLVYFPLVLLALLLQHVRSAPDSAIEERQIVGDLSFCFGTGAICDVSNALFTQCETYMQPYQPVKWYQCVCGNGYVSVDEACYYCQLAYNLSISYNGPEDKRGCSSVGVSVAPIPATIVAMESAYNKTYTGTLLTQSNVATTGASGMGKATTTAVVTPTMQPSPSITPTTPLATGSSPNIGGTSATTLQGGGQGSLQNSPTTTSASRATSTGGSGPVVGSSGSAAAIWSLFSFFMSFLYLM